MDYLTELQKLLKEEDAPVLDSHLELSQSQLKLMEAIYKRNTDISMQVEEIYDIIKDADQNANEVASAARRERLLLESLMSLNDLLGDVLLVLSDTHFEHLEAISGKVEEILDICNLEITTALGQRLDPRIHEVVAAESSDEPVEAVIRILEHGYEYREKVLRKGKVIVSKGWEQQ